MRRIAMLLLVVLLAGCKGTTGPLANHKKPQKPDLLLTPEEQQKYDRSRFPYLIDNPTYAPNSFTDRYGPTGR